MMGTTMKLCKFKVYWETDIDISGTFATEAHTKDNAEEKCIAFLRSHFRQYKNINVIIKNTEQI
jgi:hypothetical protein